MYTNKKWISSNVPVQHVCRSLPKVLPFLRIVEHVSLQWRWDQRRVHDAMGVLFGVSKKVVAGVYKKAEIRWWGSERLR